MPYEENSFLKFKNKVRRKEEHMFEVEYKDDFQKNKLKFLNELYSNENTQLAYWRMYGSWIHLFETTYNKDLMFFTANEIKSVIGVNTASDVATKQLVFSFITMYCSWAVNKGHIHTNQCESIVSKNLAKTNKKVVESNLIKLSAFWDIVKKIEVRLGVYYAVPLVLARYGVTGRQLEHMRVLKWKDVDFKNKEVYLSTIDNEDKYVSVVTVDDLFLEFVNKAKACNEILYAREAHHGKLIDNGYVLKKTARSLGSDPFENYNSINNKMYELFSSGIGVKRMSFSHLLDSRKMDMLIQMRAKRRLNLADLKLVNKMYNPLNTTVNSTLYTLKKLYETFTGDRVLRINEIFDETEKEIDLDMWE